jgi:hypothetical protein
MHVPDKARRSVFFIGDLTEEGEFRPRATAFFVIVPSSRDPAKWHAYVVTAAHVVEQCQRLGRQMYSRINRRDGGAEVIPMTVDRWWFHPDIATEATDVAVAPIAANWEVIDHDPIPLPEREATPIGSEQQAIGLGDETFAIGLFQNHAGQERNIPIVRIGNIAACPEELVSTRYGNIRAYLVEMRSIGGASGSPIFADIPAPPLPFHFMRDPRFKPPDPEEVNWFRYRFLGLVQGHFDTRFPEDQIASDGEPSGSVNSGIATVIPAQKVIETLYQPDLQAERDKIDERFPPDAVKPSAEST